MKNKILIILIAGALNATTLTQAQSNQRGQGQQQRNHIMLAWRALVRLEWKRYTSGISRWVLML